MALPNLPHTLETVTGRFIDLINPSAKDIFIEDIAWALSRLARFNGHTIHALPYSVAQHSIVVARECLQHAIDNSSPNQHRMAILGLLHDASEAYTGDISGPLKKVPEFRKVIKPIENNLQLAIYESLGIEPPSEHEEKIIKCMDVLAQRIEAYNFMVSRGNSWANNPEVSIMKLQEFEDAVPHIEAYQNFLETFNEHISGCSLTAT